MLPGGWKPASPERFLLRMKRETDLPVRLTKRNVRAASEVLTRAFHSYPLLGHFYPDERQREKVSKAFFSFILYCAFRYGEVYAASAEMEGVAIWVPSAMYPPSTGLMIRSVPLSVIFRLGMSGAAEMRKFSDFIDGVHARLAPFPHWYLETIGIVPEHQGKGLAGKLIRPMLARIGEAGLPCYLETEDPEKVPLYEHFGFRVLEETSVPGIPLTNWAMLKDR